MKISCLVCGLEFHNLSSHLSAKHNLKKADYLLLFPNAKIVSEEMSSQFSTRSEKMHAKLKEEDYAGYMLTRKSVCKTMRDNKGDDFTHSKETKEKMTDSRNAWLENPTNLQVMSDNWTKERREAQSKRMEGTTKCYTDESRNLKKMRQQDAWKRRRDDKDSFDQYLKTLSARRKEYLKEHGISLPKKGAITNIERQFIEFASEHNIEYNYQELVEGKLYDFYLPELNMLVEVDGEYWHRFPQAIKNDLEKHSIAKNKNITLVRISNTHWHPEIIFEGKETILENNFAIMNKRTTECQNLEISASIL